RLFGIGLSRGGSVHTVLRAASRGEPVYASIRLRGQPTPGGERQPDLDGRPSAVGAEVGAAELLATGPGSPGLLGSTPAVHGSPGPAPVTHRTHGRAFPRRWVPSSIR